MSRELKNHTFILMVVVALFFDGLQWLLAFVFMDWLAGFFAFLTFYIWFRLYGIKFSGIKRVATMGGALLIEVIPALAVLPAWTAAVVILVLDMRAKKLVTGDIKGALGAKDETRPNNVVEFKPRNRPQSTDAGLDKAA